MFRANESLKSKMFLILGSVLVISRMEVVELPGRDNAYVTKQVVGERLCLLQETPRMLPQRTWSGVDLESKCASLPHCSNSECVAETAP